MAVVSPVVCPNKPLPRELDVVVNISRPQTELATDMTMLCVLVKNPPFPKDNGRVRFYSTFASLEEDFPVGTEGWFAGNAFFSRQVHPTTMCIGGIFTEDSPAILRSGEVDIKGLQAIQPGGFVAHVGSTAVPVSGLDFAGVAGIEDLVTKLNAALPETAGFTFAAEGSGKLTVTVTGEDAFGYATADTTGIDVSGLLGLTEASGATLATEDASFTSGTVNFAGLEQVVSGSFTLPVNGEAIEVTDLFFAPTLTLQQLVEQLNGLSALSGKATFTLEGEGIIATCAAMEDTISFMTAGSTGASVATLLGMTKEAGAKIEEALEATDLVTQAGWVEQAAKCTGRPIYAWCLDRSYRDTEDQKAFADWCEAKTPAYFSAVTNSPLAYDAADDTNIGYYCKNKGYRRTSVFYHDNPQVYPDVSYAACALSVNYAQPDSTITLKFKTLDGVEPSPITETQLSALTSRNINCYTLIGNTSRTVREGVQSADTWFTDSLVNLDNFREELQVEVYNVFLRSKKVPYTAAGQDKLVSAAKKICARYVRNGTFADREVESDTTESGYITLPATSVVPTNIAYSTTSERASRLAPPIAIVAYEAGAMHKVIINVDVYN